jgi:hypothetical protein
MIRVSRIASVVGLSVVFATTVVSPAFAEDTITDTPREAIEYLQDQAIEQLAPVNSDAVVLDPADQINGALITIDATSDAPSSESTDPGAIVAVSDAANLPEIAPVDTIVIGIEALEREGAVEGVSGEVAASVSGGDSLVSVRPTASGVQIVSIILNGDSSEEYEYPLVTPEDMQIYRTVGGAFVFESTNQAGLGKIEAPWAADANGVSVPTHFELRGKTLVQIVNHVGGGFEYPITADPQWSYSYTAIARTGNGAIVTGHETTAQALAELRSCFNCSFPVSGAPRAYPVSGQILNLNASPFSFIEISAPVRFYKTGPATEPDWYFVAQAGHFDGAGSRINFDFYKPAGYPVRISISATIVQDNGVVANAANTFVARSTWNLFAANLLYNIRH